MIETESDLSYLAQFRIIIIVIYADLEAAPGDMVNFFPTELQVL